MSGQLTNAQGSARSGAPQASRTYASLVLPLAFAVAMPLTFFEMGGAVRATAWAWFLDLILIGSLAVVEPLHPRAVRYLLPYLAFLGFAMLSLAWTPDFAKGVLTLTQMTVPALAYLLAWRLGGRADEFTDRTARICRAALGLVVVLALFGGAGVEVLAPARRPVSISLAVLFAFICLGARSWHWPVVAGITVILVAGFTGARTATVVLLLLVICSPALRVRAPWRIVAVGLVLVILVPLSNTEAFRNRFFFDPNASLADAATLNESLNTSGRREVWPLIAEACSSTPVAGRGIGAAAGIAEAVGHFGEVHNDYLRTYCDTGLGGSILFWGFFLFAMVRCLRRARRAPSHRELQAAAGLLVLAFFVYALTDNPMVYTAHFMVPLAIILGLSDARWHASQAALRPPPPPLLLDIPAQPRSRR